MDMDVELRFGTIESRLAYLEQDSAELHDRMGKVEDKASGAWHTIQEVNARMDKIEVKVDNLEKDVKTLKSMQADTNKGIKTLTKVVGVLCVISLVFFIYIWRHDAELAKSIISLGTALSGVIA